MAASPGATIQAIVAQLEESGLASARKIEILNAASAALKDSKEPIAPSTILGLLNPHHSDADAEVRRCVVGLVEEVGKSRPELLPVVLKPLRPLVGDESPAVIKRAMQAVTSLFRPARVLLAQQAEPVPAELLEMGELLTELKAQMLGSLETSEKDAVRTNAVKFVESLVLAFHAQLTAHVAEAGQASGRVELALSWLYAEHAADSHRRGGENQQFAVGAEDGRYDAVAAPLLEAVRGALEPTDKQPDFREKLVQYAATHLDTVPQDALEVLGLDEEEEEEEQPVPMQG